MRKRRILVFCGLSVLFLLICLNTAYAEQYKVKKGDSLYSISRQLGVSAAEIKKANQLSGNKIKPGQILSVAQKHPASTVSSKSKSKPASFYTVKKGDTIYAISRKTGISVKNIAALNNVNSKNLRAGRRLILSKKTFASDSSADASAADENEDILGEDEEDDASSETTDETAYEGKFSAQLLGKWDSEDERKLFVKVATGFLGAPYRFGGATVRGIDCSAYVRKMYEFFNITLPRTAREQSYVGVRVDRNELVEGDLVFFRTKRPIGHVGIYIGNNEFVHASYAAKAVRIDSLDQPYFQKRFQRAVRVKGLDDNKGS